MDMAAIFALSRRRAGWISTSQISDANLLPYANLVYKKMQNAIVRKVNEKYFYDIFTADLVTWQSEYNLKNTSGTVVGIKKIITTNVKRNSTDTYFTKLPNSSTNLSSLSIDEQVASPDQWSFVEIKDGSLRIYPAPSNDVVWGLKVEAIVSLLDLETDSTESDIFPYNSELIDYHDIIASGIATEIYRELKLRNDYSASKQLFESELERMCDELSDRYNNDLQWALPNGDCYK